MSFSPEFLSGLVAFILTICVLSYLIGDHIFFRAAIYIFVGVSAGYVASVAWHQVISPQLLRPLLFGQPNEKMVAIFPAFLALLLLTKAVPAFSKVGTPPVAFMVGVGTAVAIGGAVMGTLIPQVMAAINAFDLSLAAQRDSSVGLRFVEASLMLFGTISTLIYFQFTAKRGDAGEYKRNPVIRVFSLIGGAFIATTFGVLFAGIYSAALMALIERLDFIISFLGSLKTLWLP